MRGRATLTRRSINSYIRKRRRVTLQPTGAFSFNLKFEIAILERRRLGLCPVIIASSAIAVSMIFISLIASPTPILTTIFSRRGTAIGLPIENLLCICGITSLRNLSNKRGVTLNDLSTCFTDTHLGPVLQDRSAKTGRFVGFSVNQHKIGNVDRGFALDQTALLILAGPALSLLHHIDPFDQDALGLRDDLKDLPGLSLFFSGDNNDFVVFFDSEHIKQPLGLRKRFLNIPNCAIHARPARRYVFRGDFRRHRSKQPRCCQTGRTCRRNGGSASWS